MKGININNLLDQEVLQIINKKLKVGEIYDSKSKLIQHLGFKVEKGGRNSRLQENKLKNFIDWEPTGKKRNQIIVTQLFDKPMKLIKRGGEREIIPYIKNIESLLINLLVQTIKNQITVPKNMLFELLHMINKQYKDCNYNTKKLSKQINIRKDIIDEFYELTDDMLKRQSHKALDNLMRKNMIWWKPIMQVVQDNIHREATNDEYEFILKAKDKTLDEMGLSREWQVIVYDRWPEYQQKLNLILKQEMNIDYCYEAYDIKLNREKIKNEWFKLSEQEKLIDQHAVNSGILERILELARRRQYEAIKIEAERNGFGKNRDEKINMRISKRYIPSYQKLCGLLIKR